MKIIKVVIMDKETHEIIEEVPMEITEVVEVVVETLDAPNTKITIVTKPEND